MPDVKASKPSKVAAEEKAVKKHAKGDGAPTKAGKPSASPPAKPKKPSKVPQPKPRPLVYPELEHHWFDKDHEGPLTEAMVDDLLGWETEDMYRAAMVAAKGGKPEDYGYTKETEALHEVFLDMEGNRVVCRNNPNNRPFDRNHALEICQEVLTLSWAGPTSMPGSKKFTYGHDEPYTMSDGAVLNKGDEVELPEVTINCEEVLVTRTGCIASAQHRLVGYKFACQRWRKAPVIWLKNWPQCPVLETAATFGTSDDPRVRKTYDKTKERTLADDLFTSDLFRGLGRAQRHEWSKMTEAAVDLLWIRTRRAASDDTRELKTNGARMELLHGHKKMKDCVEHIYNCNGGGGKGRAISVLKLSPGKCACLMYLMAAGKTDGAEYRTNPSEKRMDLSMLPRAKEFWSALVDKDSTTMRPVRNALADLDDAETGATGPLSFKIEVLCRAWHLFAAGKRVITDDEVFLSPEDYGTDAKSEQRYILDPHDFGGIDLKQEPRTRAPSKAEVIAREAAAAKERADREMAEKVATMNARRAEKGASATVAEPGKGKPPAPRLLDKPINKRDGTPAKPDGEATGKPAKKPSKQQLAQTEAARIADEEEAALKAQLLAEVGSAGEDAGDNPFGDQVPEEEEAAGEEVSDVDQDGNLTESGQRTVQDVFDAEDQEEPAEDGEEGEPITQEDMESGGEEE